MAPTRLDLDDVYAGDDYVLRLTVVDDTDDDFLLNGYTFAAQVRSAPGETATEFDVAVAANVVTLTLDKAVTATLVGRLVWDLQATVNGHTETWFAGNLYAGLDVTR